MDLIKKFENELDYNQYKVWKGIRETINESVIESWLENKDILDVASYVLDHSDALKQAIEECSDYVAGNYIKNANVESLSRRELERQLSYHQFKSWKELISGIDDLLIANYLFDKRFDQISLDIERRPTELAEAILAGKHLSPLKSSGYEPASQRNPKKARDNAVVSVAKDILKKASKKVSRPIKTTARNIYTDRLKYRISELIEILHDADDEEVGLAVASSVNFRNQHLATTGHDLFDPFTTLLQDESLPDRMDEAVAKLQSQDRNYEAVPYLIWLYTLRATQNGKLRGLGRKLWGELKRGIDFADQKAQSIEIITGASLDLTDLGRFPEGLAPRATSSTTVATNANLSENDQESELRKLKRLFDEGLITESVYKKKQAQILGL